MANRKLYIFSSYFNVPKELTRQSLKMSPLHFRRILAHNGQKGLNSFEQRSSWRRPCLCNTFFFYYYYHLL
jgi:hypothetical protein